MVSLDVWSAGAWLTAAQLAAVMVAAYAVVLWGALVVWAWRDISARTTDTSTRLAAVALVAFLLVPGAILYLAVRPPERLDEDLNRRLEAEALLREVQAHPACSRCGRSVAADFATCPYCRAQLKAECNACQRFLSLDWVACPWCSAERLPATQPALHRHGARPVPAAGAVRDGERPRPAAARRWSPRVG